MQMYYTENVKKLKFDYEVGMYRPDVIGMVETKLGKGIECFYFYVEGYTITWKKRIDIGGVN